MLRRIFLTAALSVGALAGLAAVPATAEAHPPLPVRHARFEVLVRHRNHWDRHGTYCDRADARQAARFLRARGFEVRVRRI